MRTPVLLPLAILLIACEAPEARVARLAADSGRADSVARARQDSINRARPDYIVDSILPTDEALRRFRASIGGDSVRALSGGSNTAAALIERFAAAVAKADTASLRGMALTAREFADLYYVESPYSRPPYKQPPELAWELLQRPSTEGMRRVLKELGGAPLAYVSHSCDPKASHEGKSVRHGPCLVTLRAGTVERAPQRYFGSILERDGQFKFLSFANRN